MSPSSSTEARFYSGMTAEDRVGGRRSLLVEAAIEMLDQAGWRNLTVERVCAQAGLNKRYFYESFAELDGLAAAAIDHVTHGLAEACLAANDVALRVPERAHQVMGALVTYLTDDPRRGRLLFGELAASQIATGPRELAIQQLLAVVMAEARMIHHAESSTSALIPMTAGFLLGGTGRVILDWIDGRLSIPRDELINELTTFWLSMGDDAARRGAAERT